MNTKHLLDEILDKWPAKVICLIVAIFLYFFHQASIIDSKTLVVPLKILENGVVMQVGSAPKSVSVVVRGSAEDIKLVDPSEITAYVSVDDITQKGQYTLPVQLSLSDALLVLDPFEVKLKDENLTLYVDRKAIKYVPLMPSVVGEVAHGYEVESITMNPSTIEITGPESVINSTQSVYTTRVNVSNAETNFTVETSYQNLSSIITVVDEGPYKATVTVVPVEMEKDFKDVEVASKKKVTWIVSASISEEFDEYTNFIAFALQDADDLSAVESKTNARVSISDYAGTAVYKLQYVA